MSPVHNRIGVEPKRGEKIMTDSWYLIGRYVHVTETGTEFVRPERVLSTSRTESAAMREATVHNATGDYRGLAVMSDAEWNAYQDMR
jgi:hypothetical protein